MRRPESACLAVMLLVATAVAEDHKGVHYVVAVDGDVQVQRSGWSRTSRASFGTPVGAGDRFVMTLSARATIACADLTLAEVPIRRVSPVPCAENPRAELWWRGIPVGVTRSRVTAPMVVVIAPRRTIILDPHPVVRWLPVAGATSYRVTIGKWTSPAIGETELQYPNGAPSLVAGTPYRALVEVVAPAALAAVNSSADQTPGGGFTIMSDGDAIGVRKTMDSISRLGVSNEAKTLLRANLYASRGLKTEALSMLEDLFRRTQGAEVALMVAQLYDDASSPELAKNWYGTARERAQAEGRLEPEAKALEGLAAVVHDLPGSAAAQSFLAQAIEKYRAVGSDQDVKRLSLIPR